MEKKTYIVFMLNTYGVATGHRPYVDAFRIHEDDLSEFNLKLTNDKNYPFRHNRIGQLEAFEVYKVLPSELTYFAVGLQSDVNEEAIREVTNNMLQNWIVDERKSLERKVERLNEMRVTMPIGSEAIMTHY